MCRTEGPVEIESDNRDEGVEYLVMLVAWIMCGVILE